jgi:hypothetical protein
MASLLELSGLAPQRVPSAREPAPEQHAVVQACNADGQPDALLVNLVRALARQAAADARALASNPKEMERVP